MTWINRTEDEIRDFIVAIAKEETNLTSFKEGGVLRGLIETYTKATYSLYQDVINFYGGQYTYLQASGTMLNLRGQELGVSRRNARKTLGVIQAIATKAGSIAKGTWFLTNSGLRFKSTREVAFSAGSNDVAVEAEFAGALYNILSGSSLRSTTVLDGIGNFATRADWITQGGRDEESDTDYRQRIAAKWDGLGMDNRVGKYETIALGIEGVDDVKVIRTPRGSGSLDVVIAGYAETPSESVRDAVTAALSDFYLLTRDIMVKSAIEQEQEFVLSFSGKAMVASVENTLRFWLQRRKIGEDITMHALYREALSSLDFDHLEFQSPRRDILIEDSSKLKPTAIRVSKRQ